jgi:signal transduction histidine kinase
LRTPLNAIVNLTDSISSEVENEDIKKNAKLSNTRHLGSINDILDFSKIEKGTQVGKKHLAH